MIYPGPEGGKPGTQKPVTCIMGSIDLGGGHRYLKTDGPTGCFLIAPLRLLHFSTGLGKSCAMLLRYLGELTPLGFGQLS